MATVALGFRPATNSTTVRQSVALKVVRRKGAVTNFLVDTSQEYIDAASYEMNNHLQSHVYDLIYYMIYGNKDSKTIVNSVPETVGNLEFDGIEKMISTNRINEARGGVVPASLSFLDDMIDRSNIAGGANHRRAFGMTPQMLSKVSQLLTNVRLNQQVVGSGITNVEVGGGWRLNAYRDIPIIQTTALYTKETMNAGTITLTATATAGGNLTTNLYYVQIAPVTIEGEQLASAEQTVQVTNAGSSSFSIYFQNAHVSTDGSTNVLAYKIYVGIASGAEVLVKIVPAFVYDASGSPAGDNGLTGTRINILSMTPGADVPTAMQADVPLVASNSVNPQSVYLWDMDPIQGLGKLPYTTTAGDRFIGLVTTKRLAETDDFIQFLVKSYCALTPSFEKTSVWHRGLRTA